MRNGRLYWTFGDAIATDCDGVRHAFMARVLRRSRGAPRPAKGIAGAPTALAEAGPSGSGYRRHDDVADEIDEQAPRDAAHDQPGVAPIRLNQIFQAASWFR